MTDDCLDETVLARLRERRTEAFLARVIDLFLREAPGRLEEAWLGGRGGDRARIARAAHVLGCLAGNVGAVAVRSLAREAEAAASGADPRRLPDLLHALDIALAEALACLRLARPGAP